MILLLLLVFDMKDYKEVGYVYILTNPQFS